MSTAGLLVLSTLGFGIWGVALKKAVLHMPPLAAYVASAAVQLALVPVWVLLARRLRTDLAFPATGVAWAVTAAVSVAAGTVFLLLAMRERDASSAVALTGAYPVVTLLLAALLLGEPLSPSKIGGVVAIGVGVVLLER